MIVDTVFEVLERSSASGTKLSVREAASLHNRQHSCRDSHCLECRVCDLSSAVKGHHQAKPLLCFPYS